MANTKRCKTAVDMLLSTAVFNLETREKPNNLGLGRDTLELLTTISKLRDIGIGVLFDQEHLSTESADSEHIVTIIESFAQAEFESRSKNTRWGLEKRAQDGTCGLYKRRCFGYYMDKNGDMQINVEEAKIVRSIYMMYLSGDSLIGIIKKLEKDGVKTPTGKDKWSKNTLDKLLSNEKYTGQVEIFKSFSAKQIDPVASPKTLKNKGEFQRYVMVESHPEIIPQDIFDAVQVEKTRRTNIMETDDGYKRKNTRYSVKRDSNNLDYIGIDTKIRLH